MTFSSQELFNLLPAFHRLKDAQLAKSTNLLTPAESLQLQTLQSTPAPLTSAQQAQMDALTAKASRGPLESLLMLIAEQVAAVEEDLNQLYDDEFIETCAPWVIPYIGDLIGYRPVHGVAPAVANPRAEVAHTISFRRRKGTVLVLEQLARDVTGWAAHAVEFFQLLADTQYMNHIRLRNYYAPDLRRWQPRAYMDTGFDTTAHKVDVRRIPVERGRYGIQNIGIFLWSLNAYGLERSAATAAKAVPVPASSQVNPCFRFSSLGCDMPLFNNPVPQGSEITAAANPSNVPDRLKRHVLCRDIQGGAGAIYYGEGKSLALYVGGILLSPYQIQVCDLSGPEGAWINMPPAEPYSAAVDPRLGRIALPPMANSDSPPTVQASFHYGFAGDMGGGDYARESGFAVQSEATPPIHPYQQGSPGSLLDALNTALSSISGGGMAAVEITDNGIYNLEAESAGGATIPLALHVPPGATFEFRAAEGCRPTLVLGGELVITGGAESSFYLNGFVVSYAPPAGAPAPSPGQALVHVPTHAPDGSRNLLNLLGLTHCTLVPGWALSANGSPEYAGQPAVFAESAGLTLQVQKSILGGMWVNGQVSADVSDTIIDATDPTGVAYVASTDSKGLSPAPGGPLTLRGCTVVGKVYASLLSLISDTLFWASLSSSDSTGNPPWSAPLWASRKQQGCVRFSYLPPGAIVPRHFECINEGNGSPQPIFVSLRYGDPEYGKLSPCTDDLIRRGANDGGEMGAFHFVLGPLRETDLRVRLQEYMPVGMEFGVFYET